MCNTSLLDPADPVYKNQSDFPKNTWADLKIEVDSLQGNHSFQNKDQLLKERICSGDRIVDKIR